MSKNLDEKLNGRLDEIDELRKGIAEQRAKLLKLVGLADDKPTSEPPENFSYKEEILSIFREGTEQEMRIRAVAKAIEQRKGFVPDSKVVQSSLNNLAGKELIKVEGKRGTFKLKEI